LYTFKAGLNIAVASFGPMVALEFLSVYGQHSGKLFGGDVSAVNNIIGGAGGDTAIAAWASNDMITVQVAAVVPGANLAGNANDGTGVSNASFVPMVAATYAGDFGGFDTLIEVGTMTGTATASATAPDAFNQAGTIFVQGTKGITSNGVNAQWLAAQVQGEIGDMSLGIYGDYATTKTKANATGVQTNLYGTGKVDGYSIRAEIEPIHQLMFGLGYGRTQDDAAGINTAAGTAGTLTTTKIHYAVTYEIYQNLEFTISRTETNVTGGTALNATAVANAAGATPVSNGRTKSTLVELEGVF